MSYKLIKQQASLMTSQVTNEQMKYGEFTKTASTIGMKLIDHKI